MSYLIECCDDALLVVKCQFGSRQVSLRHFFCRFLSEEKSRFSLGNRVQVDLEMNSESGWSNCNNVEERGEFYTQKIAIDVGGKHRPMMGGVSQQRRRSLVRRQLSVTQAKFVFIYAKHRTSGKQWNLFLFCLTAQFPIEHHM